MITIWYNEYREHLLFCVLRYLSPPPWKSILLSGKLLFLLVSLQPLDFSWCCGVFQNTHFHSPRGCTLGWATVQY